MISQTLCTSFKGEVLLGVHDFRATGGDTFKIAFYTANASLDATTTQYTSTGEIVVSGYTAGGVALTNSGVSTSGIVGLTSFSDASFTPAASCTLRGALIYNTTPSALSASGAALSNPAVCVLDFGADKVVPAGVPFVVHFPTADSTSAIIRFG